jgi:hypothetical protein
MDQITMGHMVIISIITVILFSIVYDPYAIIYVIGAISMLLTLAKLLIGKKKYKLPEVKDTHIQHTTPQEPEDKTGRIDKNISDINLYELNKIYGKDITESADDRISKFKKRIGDKERQAAIIQSRGLHENSIEPYYREELSAWGASRWWEPDTVLMRKATPEQMKTIQKGPMKK